MKFGPIEGSFMHKHQCFLALGKFLVCLVFTILVAMVQNGILNEQLKQANIAISKLTQ